MKVTSSTYFCHFINFMRFKVQWHRMKKEVKVKIFFDLFHLFFNLLRCRLVWIGPLSFIPGWPTHLQIQFLVLWVVDEEVEVILPLGVGCLVSRHTVLHRVTNRQFHHWTRLGHGLLGALRKTKNKNLSMRFRLERQTTIKKLYYYNIISRTENTSPGFPLFIPSNSQIFPWFFLSFHQDILVKKTYFFFINVALVTLVYANIAISWQLLRFNSLKNIFLRSIGLNSLKMVWKKFPNWKFFPRSPPPPVFPWFPWLEKVFKIFPDFII